MKAGSTGEGINKEVVRCFASTDWNMFRDSSNGIEEYTTSVIDFINKLIDDVVPTVTVHTVHTPNRNHGLQLQRNEGPQSRVSD
jgi:hypothetical protein